MVKGSRRARSKLWALKAAWIVGFLAASAWAAYNSLHRSLVDVVTLASVPVAVLGIPSAVIAIVPLLKQRTRVPEEAGLHKSAGSLAGLIEMREREQNARLLGRSTRIVDLNVRVEKSLTEEVAANPSTSAGPGPSMDTGLTVPLTELVRSFVRPGSRRLVILGQPGSGKTVASMQLMLEGLKVRRQRDPVPVRVPLAGWDSSRPFEQELTKRLVTAYPEFSPALMADLVGRRLVTPILDGLDEVDREPAAPIRAIGILRQLQAYWRYNEDAPLVLTCRSDEYDRFPPETRELGATVVRLLPVTPKQGMAFLAERAGPQRERWSSVLVELREHPSGPLAEALSTPWRLTLALTVYGVDPGRDPLQLARLGKAGIEEQLLSEYVEAATTLANRDGNGVRFAPDRVHRWLTHLAEYLDRADEQTIAGHPTSRTDLVLHELWPIGGRWAPRITHGILAGTAIAGLVAAVVRSYFSLQHVVIAAAAGFVIGLRPWPLPKLLAARWIRRRSGPRQFVMASAGLIGYTLAFTIGAASIYLGFFAVTFACGLVVVAPTLIAATVADVISPGFSDSFRFTFVGIPGLMLGFALLGLLLRLRQGVSARASAARRPYFLLLHPVAQVRARWAATARLLGMPVAGPEEAGGPRDCITSDAITAGAVGLAAMTSAGLAVVFNTLLKVTPIDMLIIFVAIFLSFSFVFFTGGAALRYCAMLICTRGRLPWRLARFLDWACDAGLMRVSGNAYQFRHLALQNHLAAGRARDAADSRGDRQSR